MHTDDRWEVRADSGAYRHEHCEGKGTYTGLTERFRADAYPWGWNTPESDGGGFEAATVIFPGVRPDNVRDSFMPHRLMPRPIPPMESRAQAFAGVLSGFGAGGTLPTDNAPWQVGAGTRIEAVQAHADGQEQ